MGDGEEVGKCRKEAVVEAGDAVEGEDVDRRVVGRRGKIEQRQPFGMYIYYDVVAKMK